MEIRVVFNSKLACYGEHGLMNAIRHMGEANSKKVAARVDYLNEDGTISKRVKPCYVVLNRYCDSPTVFVYGENKLASKIYFTLHQLFLNSEYKVKYVKDAKAGQTDMYYRSTIY